jgi:hypothetical protein
MGRELELCEPMGRGPHGRGASSFPWGQTEWRLGELEMRNSWRDHETRVEVFTVSNISATCPLDQFHRCPSLDFAH